MRGRRTSGSIPENVTRDVQVLPYDKRLDSTQLECLERVVDTEAVLARVLTDFVKVLLDESLFLDEFDVGEGLGGQFDGLSNFAFS